MTKWTGPHVLFCDYPARLGDWVDGHRSSIDAALAAEGAVLIRNCAVDGVERFGVAAQAICRDLLEYSYRSTPRTSVGHQLYTATEYPADRVIPMHNENSYQLAWPMRLLFGCIVPAATGGSTLLARTDRITERIDPEIRAAFRERGVLYVRNFGQGVDMGWQTAFGAEARQSVESFCADHHIAWEWLADDALRTRQTCHGMATHPASGQELWFNQAHLFHSSSLGAETEQTLLEVFGEDGLPRQAYYGDGGSIDADTLGHIRAAYEAEIVAHRWHAGDVLLLDNMAVAHGRAAFTGKRQVLVAMAQRSAEQPPAFRPSSAVSES